MDENTKDVAPKQEVTLEMVKNLLANTIKKQMILEGRIRFIEAQLGFKFNQEDDAKKIQKPTLIT